MPSASTGNVYRRPAKRRVERPEVELVQDRDVEEVVRERRRTVGLVVRGADRLVLLGLEHDGRAGREHHVVQDVEVIHPDAELPAELLAQEHLVLDVDALLVARAAQGRDRQVEPVVADVAAVAQDVARPDGRDVRHIEVVGLGVERKLDRLAVHADREQRRSRAVQDVREELRAEGVAGIGPLHVARVRALLDLERADAGVDDAARARIAAGDDQLRHAVGEVVVHAAVELGLLRARVRERRVRRVEGVVNRPDRARERVRPVERRRHLVRPAVVDGPGMRQVRVERAAVAGVRRLPVHVAVEGAEAHRNRGALHLARRFRDDVDHAGHRVGPPDGGRGPANHLDLLDFGEVDRQEVPADEPEEVEVDAPAVDERQLRRRQRAGGAPARDVEIAGRGLRHVDAGDRAEQARVVLRRLALEHLLPDHADRGRRVDQLLLDLRGRDDNLLFVAGRLLRRGLGFLLVGGRGLGRWSLRLRLSRRCLNTRLRGGRRLRRLGEGRGRGNGTEQHGEHHGESTRRHSILLLYTHRSSWRRGRLPRPLSGRRVPRTQT